LRRSLLAPALPARSVRRLPGPFAVAATPVFHRPPGLSAGARRVLVPFTAHVFSCRESTAPLPKRSSATWPRYRRPANSTG